MVAVDVRLALAVTPRSTEALEEHGKGRRRGRRPGSVARPSALKFGGSNNGVKDGGEE